MDSAPLRSDPTLPSAPEPEPWLLIIDPQRIFADPASEWCSPFFPAAMENIARLAESVGPERTLITRWLPTADRATAWGEYFRDWPFADVPAEDSRYELVDAAQGLSAHPTIDEPTFGKWGRQLAERVGWAANPATHLLVTGVTTDCCVISTVLPAADAGVRLSVVTDAVAHSAAENGAAALHTMSLFPPQVDLRSTDEILANGTIQRDPGRSNAQARTESDDDPREDR
ncbi:MULTISPECIES: cysteine hydrolase family protein [unclassified Brachybacterium]|uniref:cysteine hydrolase family protein n=1 Tax=unclassified Brachybacterium TaxID=2623841 RepID=UPI003FB84739